MILDELSQELENIFIKDIDKDGKIKLEEKAELKKRLNRSPDYADMVMFRMIWVVKELEERRDTKFAVENINYDDLLY